MFPPSPALPPPGGKGGKAVWKPLEDKAFAEQAKFEEDVLALYKKDPKKARRC